ncbi:MAG: FtsQ-type POTRA domain-containing protein [Ruminococcus sp.]|nr:FtsQ-type POTRA domain-containing protein [Ruminococcus sp.]
MSGKNDRKKMIREAKNYQRERKLAEEKNRRSKSVDKTEPIKKPVKSNKNIKRNVSENLPSNVYNDNFFVDESKIRKQKAAKIKKYKNKNQKAPLSPKRRKIKHIITYVIIFSVVLIIGLILSLTVLFKTEKINVEGNTLYDEQLIVQLSSVQMEENIFLAKFNSTPEKIKDTLPYIEDVRVDFKIPDTITITVKNAEPAYVLVSNNQFYKVSAEGRILELSDENIENLPIILCSEIKNTEVGKYIEFADDNITKILKDINACITENEYEGISYIDVRKPANINMIYDNRIKIIIGLPEDIGYKLKTAMTIIIEKLDQNGAVKAEGTLNVSECNSTKKSYFKDEEITLDVTVPTKAVETALQQPTTQPVTDSDNASDADDGYTWQSSDDGGYSPDDYSGDGDWGDYSDGDYSDDGDWGDYSDSDYSDDDDWGDYSDGDGSDDDDWGDYSDGDYSDDYGWGDYSDNDYSTE